MEKKLPDDRFEEFLQNSFAQYKEEPSDKVWDRLDASLKAAPSSTTPWFRKYFFPMAATVFSVAFTYLIYANYQLKRELNNTISKNEKKSQPSLDLNGESAISNENINMSDQAVRNSVDKENINSRTNQNKSNTTVKVENRNENSVVNKNENSVEIANGNHKKQLEIESKNKGFLSTANNSATVESNDYKSLDKPILNKNQKHKSSDIIKNSNQKNQLNSYHLENNTVKSVNKRNKKINSSKPNINISKDDVANITRISKNIKNKNSLELNNNTFSNDIDSKIDPIANESKESATSNKREKMEFPSIDTKVQLLTSENRNIKLNAIYPASLLAQIPRGIDANEVMFYAGQVFESGSIKDEPPMSGHAGPKGLRKNEFKTLSSWQAGLTLNKFMTKNLYFTAGVGLKHFEMLNEISQILPFGDKKPKPGGGGTPFQHDFDFRINCNAGISNIVIESEQLDQRASISDAQPLELKVRTKFDIDYLSFPIGLQWRYSKNRLFAGIGAGINLDVLTKAGISTSEVQFLNNILKPREQPDKFKFSQTKDFVLNGKLNATVGYKLNNRIRFLLSPEFYIPMSDRSKSPGNVDTNAWGIQAGISVALNSL